MEMQQTRSRTTHPHKQSSSSKRSSSISPPSERVRTTSPARKLPLPSVFNPDDFKDCLSRDVKPSTKPDCTYSTQMADQEFTVDAGLSEDEIKKRIKDVAINPQELEKLHNDYIKYCNKLSHDFVKPDATKAAPAFVNCMNELKRVTSVITKTKGAKGVITKALEEYAKCIDYLMPEVRKACIAAAYKHDQKDRLVETAKTEEEANLLKILETEMAYDEYELDFNELSELAAGDFGDDPDEEDEALTIDQRIDKASDSLATIQSDFSKYMDKYKKPEQENSASWEDLFKDGIAREREEKEKIQQESKSKELESYRAGHTDSPLSPQKLPITESQREPVEVKVHPPVKYPSLEFEKDGSDNKIKLGESIVSRADTNRLQQPKHAGSLTPDPATLSLYPSLEFYQDDDSASKICNTEVNVIPIPTLLAAPKIDRKLKPNDLVKKQEEAISRPVSGKPKEQPVVRPTPTRTKPIVTAIRVPSAPVEKPKKVTQPSVKLSARRTDIIEHQDVIREAKMAIDKGDASKIRAACEKIKKRVIDKDNKIVERQKEIIKKPMTREEKIKKIGDWAEIRKTQDIIVKPFDRPAKVLESNGKNPGNRSRLLETQVVMLEQPIIRRSSNYSISPTKVRKWNLGTLRAQFDAISSRFSQKQRELVIAHLPELQALLSNQRYPFVYFNDMKAPVKFPDEEFGLIAHTLYDEWIGFPLCSYADYRKIHSFNESTLSSFMEEIFSKDTIDSLVGVFPSTRELTELVKPKEEAVLPKDSFIVGAVKHTERVMLMLQYAPSQGKYYMAVHLSGGKQNGCKKVVIECKEQRTNEYFTGGRGTNVAYQEIDVSMIWDNGTSALAVSKPKQLPFTPTVSKPDSLPSEYLQALKKQQFR